MFELNVTVIISMLPCEKNDSLSSFRSQLFVAKGIDHRFYGKGGDQLVFPYQVKQVHGTTIVDASLADGQRQADGIFTTRPKVKIAIKTADCLPILCVTEGYGAAIHAGWRGLFAGILANAVELLLANGGDLTTALWAIGPAISVDNYQVGDDFLVASRDLALTDEQTANCCQRRDTGNYWNLSLSAKFALINLGVPITKIDTLDLCTYDNHLHSYRRDQQATGTNWSYLELDS